jgi:ribonuclease D
VVRRAKAMTDDQLPEPSTPPSDGPPPAHRWSERDPIAAKRLVATRAAVAALADAGHLPAENLLAPDAVRRLAWAPPEPLSAESVADELRRYGSRPWQIEMTALPIAMALTRLIEKGEA